MDRVAARLTPREGLGRTIRELRQRRGLTLVQLAERTRLSHSFLSQIERGLAQPSMSSLHRIALALNTTQDQLIAERNAYHDGPAVALLRRGEGMPIPAGGGTGAGTARQLLAGPDGFFPTEFVGLDRAFGDFLAHDGNEFLYIAEGMIEVDLGQATYTLEPGDSLRYPGTLPHRWRGLGPAHTRVLMVHTGVNEHPLGGPGN